MNPNRSCSKFGVRWAKAILSFLLINIIITDSCYAWAQVNTAEVPRYSCAKPDGATFTEGVLPNAKIAGMVATQILNGIYGAKIIASQLPLQVVARADRYIINGLRPKRSIGGNATIVLCKSNAAVIFMSHSK